MLLLFRNLKIISKTIHTNTHTHRISYNLSITRR